MSMKCEKCGKFTDSFLKSHQVAYELGVSKKLINDLSDKGEIPFLQVGKYKRLYHEKTVKYVLIGMMKSGELA